MDLVLKYLPLIIFIYPILSWLDSRKRFTHNAKFYSDRAISVKKYEEECLKPGITDYEKSAFAQALVATDKLGFRDIDIIKSKFPDRFFIMINKLKKIRHKIEIKRLMNDDVFMAKQTSSSLKLRPLLYLILYFTSIPIFISNNLLVVLFKFMGCNLILVDANTYLFSQWGTLIVGVVMAIFAALKFINHEVLMSLLKEEAIMTKDDFQRIKDAQVESEDHFDRNWVITG